MSQEVTANPLHSGEGARTGAAPAAHSGEQHASRSCCFGHKNDAPLADENRGCRDLPFLLLFIAFWGGVVAIAAVGFKQGSPQALIYGLDYAGHTCGKNNKVTNVTSALDLRAQTAQYWLNPNEVIQANGYGFSLADAQSICLGACPALLPQSSLAWVCKYPSDWSPAHWNSSVASQSAWAAAKGNLYSSMSPAGLAASCGLTGPCYPVLTSQANVWNTCTPQTLSNLPVSAAAVAGLTTCISCCSLPSPYSGSQCGGPLNANGSMNSVFNYVYPAGTNASNSPNNLVACLSSCQTLHGSINSYVANTKGSVHPLATALFQATCAAANASAALVPAPGTSDGGAMAMVVASLTSSYKSVALRYAGDLLTSWKAMVVCGLFLPFIMSFLWLLLMRRFAGPIVWLTILCVCLSTAGVTLFCFSKAGAIGGNNFDGIISFSDAKGFSFNSTAVKASISQLQTTPPSGGNVTVFGISDVSTVDRRQMYYLGIASALLTIVTWIFTAILWSRIRIAVAVIKVACDAMRKVPALLIFPLFGALLVSGFMVWWVAVAAYVYSSGKIVKRDCCAQVQSSFTKLFPAYAAQSPSNVPSCAQIHCGYTVVMNKSLQHSLIYHGFEFLWTTQFIVSYSILTVSLVAHKCYLNGGGAGVALPAFPLRRAMYTTARYYLGSIALGSLVVASFQFFRYFILFLFNHLKAVSERNRMVRILMYAVSILLCIVQRIVELIAHSAYTIVAQEGVGYCSASMTAARLLVSNSVRVGTLVVVADYVLFLAKLGTSASSAFFTFVYLDSKYGKGKISSPLVPVIVVFLTAYAIACVTFGVVEQAVSATMLLFLDDCDKHGGEPTWAPQELLEAVGMSTAHDEEQKAKKHGYCTRPEADAQP
jgi:hypothetical protein